MGCAEFTIGKVPAGEDDQTRWGFVRFCFTNDDLDTEFEHYEDFLNDIFESTVPEEFFIDTMEGDSGGDS